MRIELALGICGCMLSVVSMLLAARSPSDDQAVFHLFMSTVLMFLGVVWFVIASREASRDRRKP